MLTSSGHSPRALLGHQLCSQRSVCDGLLRHVRHALQVGVALCQRMGVTHHAPYVLQAHARGCCQAVLDVQPGLPHNVQAVPALPSASRVNTCAGAGLAAAVMQQGLTRPAFMLAMPAFWSSSLTWADQSVSVRHA